MAGWSLLELLVAMGLSMSLATVALQAYLAGSSLQAEVTAELRLQEGARFALHALGRNVRMAGFPGCLGEAPESSLMSSQWTEQSGFIAVEGWSPEKPHEQLTPVPGTDALALWWAVSGCSTDGPPELQPPADSQGPHLRGSMFYIGRRGNAEASPEALFVRALSNFDDSSPARELVEGVESMQVVYGAPGDSTGLPAHLVRDWNEVTSLRIDLRLRSLTVPGLRREFSQTLALRNGPWDAGSIPRPDSDEREEDGI